MPQPLGSYRSATELRPREGDASLRFAARLAPYGHAKLLDAPKREAIEAEVKALPRPVVAAIKAKFGNP
jgi:hypothetical protein